MKCNEEMLILVELLIFFFIFFHYYWWDIVRRKNTIIRDGSSRALLDPFFEGRRETDEEFYAL